MELFGVYEGAAYYFNEAESHIEENEYEQSIQLLTKGYKHINDTPVVRKTKARVLTETAVNALQDERGEVAQDQLSELTGIVESRQHAMFESPTDWQR